MEQEFDLIVLGAGPGGYPAAIRAAERGLKVALIEKDKVGGTCLNRGCIPSKALIASAEVWHKVLTASSFGIKAEGASFDYPKMVANKDLVVDKMVKSLGSLIASHPIELFKGEGVLTSTKTVKVTGEKNAILRAKNIIIATGSEPKKIASLPFDGKFVLDSTDILALEKLPKSLLIVGGGVIGCEFASLFSKLGVKVTVVELLPRLLPMEDEAVSKALTSAFQKNGVQVRTSLSIDKMSVLKDGVEVVLSNGEKLFAEKMLVSVGRELNTSSIGLEKAGVEVQKGGGILVNDKMQTNVPGIYAIGDIASKYWLAHVATHQGIVAADVVAGVENSMHYSAIPSVIFTSPEIATVGLSYEAAKEKGLDVIKGIFPYLALGKAQAIQSTEGFFQIVADAKTHQILGAQVVGDDASTLIAEMAAAITEEFTLEAISNVIHAHPTLSEGWPEASFLTIGMPLHLPEKKVSRKS